MSEYVDSTGTVVAHYEYDAFGQSTPSTTNTKSFTHQFSTKQLDAETGLNYYGYRYCDSGNGRWLGRDPLADVFFFELLAVDLDHVRKVNLLSESYSNIYAFIGNVSQNGVDLLGLTEQASTVCPCDCFSLSVFEHQDYYTPWRDTKITPIYGGGTVTVTDQSAMYNILATAVFDSANEECKKFAGARVTIAQKIDGKDAGLGKRPIYIGGSSPLPGVAPIVKPPGSNSPPKLILNNTPAKHKVTMFVNGVECQSKIYTVVND